MDIAILDDSDKLVDVREAGLGEHVTDKVRKTVALPAEHALRSCIGSYMYDWTLEVFRPVDGSLFLYGRQLTAVLDGLVDAVGQLAAEGANFPPSTFTAVALWREWFAVRGDD